MGNNIQKEFRILLLATILMGLVFVSYIYNTKYLLGAIPIILYYIWKFSTPIDALIPYAIIATWGAEIWNTANSSLYTVLRMLVLLIFFLGVLKNYKKNDLGKFLIPLMIFILYNIINEFLLFSESKIVFYINLIICYVVIYIVSRHSTWDDFESISFAIGIGVLFSAVISLLSVYIPMLFDIVKSMIQTDNTFGGDVIDVRFSSLTYDPNLFGMYVDCALALNLIVIIVRQFQKSILRLILCCLLFAVGLMTLSKAYFLVTFILLFYSYICIAKSTVISNKRKIYINIFLTIIVVAFSYYMADYFDALFSRFDSKKSSDLTTGRSDIMSYYINYLFDNIDTLLFGNTLLGLFKNYSTPHNFAIYLLFYFGIIGSILYFAFIVRIVTLNRKFRITQFKYFKDIKLHYLPLGIYLLFSFTIDPFALYDVKMIFLAASFTALQPLKKIV